MQAVILSGGMGRRLWPASSKMDPKPFFVLADGQSLLQKVFLRAADLGIVTDIITVANKNFLARIQDEYNKVEHLVNQSITSQFILEPFAKNTAAAIAAAALQIEKYYGLDTVMLLLPVDHMILNQERFKEAVIKAKKLALNGELVTFGIKPDTPETGYGYIKYNGKQVERFIEKPNFKLAQEYLQNSDFLWNSGMFCFSVGSILQEMARYCPLILDKVRCSIHLANSIGDKNIELNDQAFSSVPEESIDYAVMQKSDRIVVIPCDIGWQDIGNWESWSRLTPADANGNRINGNAILHDVSNCYIENNGQLIGVVGVQNLAIISTKNGLLVTNKKKSEAVCNIYSQLHGNIKDLEEFTWGKVRMLQKNQAIILHQFEINLGTTVDISDHFQYTAHWIVVHGLAQFLINNQQIILTINDSKYIAQDELVSIANIGNERLLIITVQLGDYVRT